MSEIAPQHEQLVAAIRRWPEQDQAFWRAELDVNPEIALLLALLADRFDAGIVADPLERINMPLNPQLNDRVPEGAVRRAPDEARLLLARLIHDTEETRAA